MLCDYLRQASHCSDYLRRQFGHARADISDLLKLFLILQVAIRIKSIVSMPDRDLLWDNYHADVG
jgi:hypothetical protein